MGIAKVLVKVEMDIFLGRELELLFLNDFPML
jgi:hypothetical protein